MFAESSYRVREPCRERLRETREAQGLSLAEIAARTRIPIRQLEAIETSNFAALPSVTYSVGFAKAYARAVGADEVAIGREVRALNDRSVRRTDYEAYDIPDSSRVPTSGIAIAGLVVAVLLLIAIGLWYGTNLFRSEDAAPAPAASTIIAPVPTATTPPVTAGQVTLVARDQVWLRVYDAAGKTLFENTLNTGERYDVPSDANGPMINVGRPDQLQVMLNGSELPALGSGERAIKDVGISAVALTARANATPSPTSAGATTNSAGPDARATFAPAFESAPQTGAPPAP